MKLRAVIEVDYLACSGCGVFPDCEECFVGILIGKIHKHFCGAKLLKVEKVKNGK